MGSVTAEGCTLASQRTKEVDEDINTWNILTTHNNMLREGREVVSWYQYEYLCGVPRNCMDTVHSVPAFLHVVAK